MILVPLGHGESTVRRLPWVTFALIALCVVVHLAILASAADVTEVPEVGAADAWAYWEEHPYLQIDPALLDAVGAPKDPARRESLVDNIRMQRAILSPDDAAVLQSEQAQLDRMTAIAVKGAAAVAGDPIAVYGFTPARPTALGLVSHLFVHEGWIHLLGNLFLLFLAAPALEDRWGRLLFVGFYLASGIAGAATHAAFTKHPELPLVGASGAIAGAMGAFLVRLHGTPIKFFYALFFGLRVRAGTFEAPAWVMLPLWFAGELLSGVLGMEQGVAVWAHAGGFAFGAAFALAMRATRVEERWLAPAIEQTVTTGGNAALARALAARERGDLDGAWRLLQAERRTHPHDPELVSLIFDLSRARGDAAAAAPAVLTLVKRMAMTGDVAGAAERWRELVQHAPEARAEPRALLAIAQHLRGAGDADGAALALRHAGESKTVGAALAGRIANEAREVGPAAAAPRPQVEAAPPASAPKAAARKGAEPARATPPPPIAPPSPAPPPAPASAPAADPPWMLAEAEEPDALDLEAMELDTVAPEAAPAPSAAPAPARATPAPAASGAWEDMDARALDFDASEQGGLDLELAGEKFVTGDDQEAAARDVETPRAPSASAPPAAAASAAAAASEPTAAPASEPDEMPSLDDFDLGSDLAAAALPRFAKLEVTQAVVRELRETEIALTILGRDRAVTLGFGKVEAIALAEITERGAPRLVLDLALSWRALAEGGSLRVVRLQGERGAVDVSAPLRLLAEEIAQRSGAAPLTPAVQGGEAPRFADLAAYEREILLVGD